MMNYFKMIIRLLKFYLSFVHSAQVIVCLIAFIALQGCGKDRAGDSKDNPATKATKNSPQSKPVLVELMEIKRGTIEEILERSAALQAEEQVQVLARTQNPAIELLVEEGDHVEKDQVLLRLESDRQKTVYDQAMTQFDKTRIEFERLEKLHNESLISESEYLNAKFAYDQARLQLDTAKRDLDYTEVRAPIQGTITARSVKVGDKVTTGTSIFEIINLESTVAVVHAPEQYLPKLKKDMQARLISATLDNQVFEGYVKRISPVVDAEAGTVKVVVGVKERGSLSPGMWVQVELVLDENDEAILIPKRSITYAVDQTFAFKVDTDEEGVRRAKRQLVVVRNSDKEHIEPVEGFEEGDLIVVAGQGGLKDDSAIRELSELESVQDPVESGNVADTSSPAVENSPKTKPGK
ncbi:MAG: efflux RND transporter periplasmic adaptor subunit [Verrucomicrobia bacterium]|nr:efflux RND transporter periplasmic adaptor subunit [Verrucomicrobiota bacterium]